MLVGSVNIADVEATEGNTAIEVCAVALALVCLFGVSQE